MFRTKASMPDAAAREMSCDQVETECAAVLPTTTWAKTYLACARGRGARRAREERRCLSFMAGGVRGLR